MTITSPESVEVRRGIVETVSKMFGSFDSDRLFGMVENETEPSIDEEVAPFGLESVWEDVKNVWSCFIINFCGVKQDSWHGYISSAGPKGVYDRVVGVNDPPWNLVTIFGSSRD